MRSRPPLTCDSSIHEIGAKWLYHGLRVSFEWQSRQDRSRIDWTDGGVDFWARSEAPGSVAGLVRSARTNCAPIRKTRTTARIHPAHREKRTRVMRRRRQQIRRREQSRLFVDSTWQGLRAPEAVSRFVSRLPCTI